MANRSDSKHPHGVIRNPNVRVYPMKALEVKYIDQHGEARTMSGKGVFCGWVHEGDVHIVRPFMQYHFGKKEWWNKPLLMGVEPYYRPRTLAMNRLLWALMEILSLEVYSEPGHKETLYEDMLDLHAPKVVSKLTGKAHNVRSSEMDVQTMSMFLEAIFRELAEMGVSIENAAAINDYWLEWYRWRGEQKTDPMANAYKGIEDYRESVLYCEACRKFQRGSEGQVAHIVSRGSGGTDEGWNLIKLCTEHHLYTQHQQGWERLLKEYPHLRFRVKQARERAGKKQIGGNDESEAMSAPVDG